MSKRSIVVLVFLWMVSLVGVATVVAQSPIQPQPRAPIAIAPNVIAGPDVGFIPTGFSGNTPMGRLVVRVNGKWVDVLLGGGKVVPLN